MELLSEQARSVDATLVVASHDARIRGSFEMRFELQSERDEALAS